MLRSRGIALLTINICLSGCLCLFGCLPGCLAGRPACLPGCLAAWLPACLAAWLPGWLSVLNYPVAGSPPSLNGKLPTCAQHHRWVVLA